MLGAAHYHLLAVLPLHYVKVALSPGISVAELVCVPHSELHGELLSDLLVGHVVVLPRTDLAQQGLHHLWGIDVAASELGPPVLSRPHLDKQRISVF